MVEYYDEYQRKLLQEAELEDILMRKYDYIAKELEENLNHWEELEETIKLDLSDITLMCENTDTANAYKKQYLSKLLDMRYG